MKPAAYLTWPRLLFTLTMYLAMLVSTRSRSSGLPLVTAAEIVSLVTAVCPPPGAVPDPPGHALHPPLLQVPPELVRQREEEAAQHQHVGHPLVVVVHCPARAARPVLCNTTHVTARDSTCPLSATVPLCSALVLM